MEERATYTTTTAEPPVPSGTAPPQDLCPRAVKLARRVQALKNDRVYTLKLVKRADRWVLAVREDGKAEVIR